MMKIVYSREFLSSVKQLQKIQQKKLSKLLLALQENPFHTLLHTKRLKGPLLGILSFRITRDWRVMFQFIDAATIQLLRVAHRNNIYR